MKRTIFITSLTLFGVLLIPLHVEAQVGGLIAARTIGEVIGLTLCRIFFYAFNILMLLSTIFVVWAAYIYVTSGGDEEKVNRATKTITYAAVAVGVALLANGFPFIVASVFGTRFLSGGCRFGLNAILFDLLNLILSR